jgi:hypothetical protein
MSIGGLPYMARQIFVARRFDQNPRSNADFGFLCANVQSGAWQRK